MRSDTLEHIPAEELIHHARRHQHSQGWPTRKLPAYVASPLPLTAPRYDIIYCDFDAGAVEAELGSLIGPRNVQRFVYATPKNDTTVLVEYFRLNASGKQ